MFFAALLLAILIDTGFDLLSLRQTKLVDDTGGAVNRTYQVLNCLTGLGIALRSNVEARFFKDEKLRVESLKNLGQYYAELKSLGPDPELLAYMRGFEAIVGPNDTPKAEQRRLRLTEKNYESLGLGISRSRKLEQARLLGRLQRHRNLSRAIRNQIWAAAVFEICLTVVVGASWFLIDRQRRRNLAELQAGLIRLEQSEGEIRTVLAERSSQLRTTVHDLKNPLGSIMGFSELIGQESQNPENVLEMSRTLMRISERTLDMVNSLTLEERDRAALERAIRPINLVAYVEDVLMALKPQLTLKEQNAQTSYIRGDVRVVGEPRALWDLLMNILGNAVKYSPIGGEIRIRTTATRTLAILEIEDEGPGFTADDKKLAFGEYRRLSAKPSAGEASSGLGLFSAKQVVKRMGGRIEIRDRPLGTGALIYIELPLAQGRYVQIDRRRDEHFLTS